MRTLKHIILTFLLFPYTVLATVGGNFTGPAGTIDPGGDTLSLIVARVITYAIGIAGMLAVIGITWGGIQMILASGEDEKFKKARYTMIFSLIGVVIAGIAYWLVGFISGLRF